MTLSEIQETYLLPYISVRYDKYCLLFQISYMFYMNEFAKKRTSNQLIFHHFMNYTLFVLIHKLMF